MMYWWLIPVPNAQSPIPNAFPPSPLNSPDAAS
jgi:hypothetical protein